MKKYFYFQSFVPSRGFRLPVLAIFFLFLLLNGCAKRSSSQFSKQKQWYSSNYSHRKVKKKAADAPPYRINPKAKSKSGKPKSKIKKEIVSAPAVTTEKKTVKPWQISGKIRKIDKLFISYTRWRIKDNGYFNNIRRAGLYLKNDIALMFEYGYDKDTALPGYSVTNTNLSVRRVGFVLRKYLGNSFYVHLAAHEIDLSGTLSFYDSDFGGTNHANLSSDAQTLSFGIGNEWFLDQHLTFGFDWLVLPTVVSRNYHFSVQNSSDTDTAIELVETFAKNDPISAQARLWGAFVFNVGWMF